MSDELKCLISSEVMVDAVVTPYGHTYSEKALKEWLETGPVSPQTRQPLHPSQLIANKIVRVAGSRSVKREYLAKDRYTNFRRQAQAPLPSGGKTGPPPESIRSASPAPCLSPTYVGKTDRSLAFRCATPAPCLSDTYAEFGIRPPPRVLPRLRAPVRRRGVCECMSTDELKCLISSEVMVDAVVTPYGHTYSEKALKEWLETEPVSPQTRQPLEASQLVPNRIVRDIAERSLTGQGRRPLLRAHQLLLDREGVEASGTDDEHKRGVIGVTVTEKNFNQRHTFEAKDASGVWWPVVVLGPSAQRKGCYEVKVEGGEEKIWPATHPSKMRWWGTRSV